MLGQGDGDGDAVCKDILVGCAFVDFGFGFGFDLGME